MKVTRRPIRSTLTKILSLGAASVLLACAPEPVEEPELTVLEEALTGDAAEVLATVGEAPVTRVEVEEPIRLEILSLQRSIQDRMDRALNRAIEEKLLEQEAAARETTVEELLDTEVDQHIVNPSDEQIEAFYEQQQARFRQPLEQVFSKIGAYLRLQQKNELRTELLKELSAKYSVEKLVQPPRFKVVTRDAPSIGNPDAPITVVEFSDFECPFCQLHQATLTKLRETYGDRLRLVYKHYPLAGHPAARKAAEASMCANDQGRFWEMHDGMFAQMNKLAVDDLKELAESLGLDTETFNECLDSGRWAAWVEQDLAQGKEVGVTGTPALFINGIVVSGAASYETIAAVIDEELDRLGIAPPTGE